MVSCILALLLLPFHAPYASDGFELLNVVITLAVSMVMLVLFGRWWSR